MILSYKQFSQPFLSMSMVVYAGLLAALKEDLLARASERGLTLNRALVQLLEQALAARTEPSDRRFQRPGASYFPL